MTISPKLRVVSFYRGASMNFPCAVFDSEALLSDQDTAAICWLAAAAGCTLEELRAWANWTRVPAGKVEHA